MSSDSPKRLLFSHFAALARALGNPHRLELLELLAQGEQPVEVLTHRTGISFANVSQHLQQLRKVGLVTPRRVGKNILYSLQDGPVIEAISALRALAEHNMAAVQDVLTSYFDALDGLEPVDADDLISRLENGDVILLDVRPGDEFKAGHIPKAVNIELEQLESRLSELPRDQEIIAYCRGPYCVLSFQAVQALRARGYTARRFKEGFPEWKAASRPVELA